MTPGIKGRVGEHGNSDEFYLVQNGFGAISTSPTGSGLTILVSVELEAFRTGISFRCNGIIGTHHGAHGATNACLLNGGFLFNAIPGFKPGQFSCSRIQGGIQVSFSENIKFYGLHRADGGTLTAQGTPVLFPVDPPGQIAEA
jgi:hypothetical protein